MHATEPAEAGPKQAAPPGARAFRRSYSTPAHHPHSTAAWLSPGGFQQFAEDSFASAELPGAVWSTRQAGQLGQQADLQAGYQAAAAAITAAAAAAANNGQVPAPLLRLVSPLRAHLDEVRRVGAGGFGSVTMATNRLDGGVVALKRVPFNSRVPPWAPPELLEAHHDKLLREVRALTALRGSPYIVEYHAAWVEPHWERLAERLQQPHRRLPSPAPQHAAAARSAQAPTDAAAAQDSILRASPVLQLKAPAATPSSSASTAPSSPPSEPVSNGAPPDTADRSAAGGGSPPSGFHSPGPGSPCEHSPRGCRRGARGVLGSMARAFSWHYTVAEALKVRAPELGRKVTSCIIKDVCGEEASLSGSSSHPDLSRGASEEWASPAITRHVSSPLPCILEATEPLAASEGLPAVAEQAASSPSSAPDSPSSAAASQAVGKPQAASLPAPPEREPLQPRGSFFQEPSQGASSLGETSASASQGAWASYSSQLSGLPGGLVFGNGSLAPRTTAETSSWPARGVTGLDGADSSASSPSTTQVSSADSRTAPAGKSLVSSPQRAGALHAAQAHSNGLDATGLVGDGKPWPMVLLIMMQLVAAPTLAAWLAARNQREAPLGPGALLELEIFRQIVMGVAHIHAHGIMHRDLKPANIFVTEAPTLGDASMRMVQVQICDFGLSVMQEAGADMHAAATAAAYAMPDGSPHFVRVASGVLSPESSSSDSHTSGVGTASYSAPEQQRGSGQYGAAVDMWPLGLILVELLTPFQTGMERAAALRAAREGALPPAMLHRFPEAAVLAARLLQVEAGQRPSMAEVLAHPLVASCAGRPAGWPAPAPMQAVQTGLEQGAGPGPAVVQLAPQASGSTPSGAGRTPSGDDGGVSDALQPLQAAAPSGGGAGCGPDAALLAAKERQVSDLQEQLAAAQAELDRLRLGPRAPPPAGPASSPAAAGA